jgi:hypothetical protein
MTTTLIKEVAWINVIRGSSDQSEEATIHARLIASGQACRMREKVALISLDRTMAAITGMPRRKAT